MKLCRRVATDERGVAVVVAVGVMLVALTLSLLIVQVAMRENRSSGVDRQRAVAVNAAEAGVDSVFTAIQSAGTALPCPGIQPAMSVAAGADAPVATTVIRYFRPDDNEIATCSELHSMTTAFNALITSTATTRTIAGGGNKGNRAMQAYVGLNPVSGTAFGKAIFGGGTVTVNNNHTIRGNDGNDADVYSNTDVVCDIGSNQTYQGSIYSQGSVTIIGRCSALGEVWAKNAVRLDNNQSTIGGKVVSSTSSVSLANVSKISGTVMAGTTVDPTSCVAPKCIRGLLQGPPPYEPFPQLRSSLVDQWAPAFTVNPKSTDCTNVVSLIKDTYAKKTTPQVFQTSCAVNFNATRDIPLYTDLVIYADGGFSSLNQVTFTSGDGQPHRLYWVVPYEQSAPGCTKNITTDNNFGIDPKISLLMYTPCDAIVSNHATHVGQIYAGQTVTIDNNFDMQFVPLPVYGVDPTSLPLASYDLDIVYKREVRP